MKFKVRVEVEHLHEISELIMTVDRHRVGTCLVLIIVLTASVFVALLTP